jgi:hypothetical protein
MSQDLVFVYPLLTMTLRSGDAIVLQELTTQHFWQIAADQTIGATALRAEADSFLLDVPGNGFITLRTPAGRYVSVKPTKDNNPALWATDTSFNQWCLLLPMTTMDGRCAFQTLDYFEQYYVGLAQAGTPGALVITKPALTEECRFAVALSND